MMLIVYSRQSLQLLLKLQGVEDFLINHNLFKDLSSSLSNSKIALIIMFDFRVKGWKMCMIVETLKFSAEISI